jgi:hypothetical protein
MCRGHDEGAVGMSRRRQSKVVKVAAEEAWKRAGWIALIILLFKGGDLALAWVVALICIAALFFMFRAPVWWGAVTRDDTLCRNNAHGLLMGCQLREHRWQKFRMLIVTRKWRPLARCWSKNPVQSIGCC